MILWNKDWSRTNGASFNVGFRENRKKILKTGRIQGISLSGVVTFSFNNYLSSDSIFIYYYLLGPRRKKKIRATRVPENQLEATASAIPMGLWTLILGPLKRKKI